jgi:hypothetical protein
MPSPSSAKKGPKGKKVLETPKHKNLPIAPSPIPNLADDDDSISLTAKIGNKLSPATQESVQQALEPVRAAKRNFSELSSHSVEKGSPNKLTKELDNPFDQPADQPTTLLRAMLKVKEKSLGAGEEIVRILNKEWNLGDLKINKDIFDDEISRIEKHICQMQADIVILHTSFNAICGALRDSHLLTPTMQADDQAYVDLLLQRYRTPPQATLSLFKPREPLAQQRFRRDVFKAYGAISSDHDDDVWCVIHGQWIPSSNARAAHIVRYNVGEISASHLFGPATDKNGHLMSAMNGLPMADVYEQAFDEARLVIVPNEKGELIVVVLDEEIKNKPEPVTPWPKLHGGLHGRRLQFPNEFRPSMRYLYLSCCTNILRRQRHNIKGWTRDRLGPLMPRKNWASPGDYLRTSTLQKLARLVGHVTGNEANEFASNSPFDDIETGTTEAVDTTHAQIVKAAVLGVGAVEEQDKEETDEVELYLRKLAMGRKNQFSLLEDSETEE